MKTASELIHFILSEQQPERVAAIQARDREVFEKAREACAVEVWIAMGVNMPALTKNVCRKVRALTFEEAMK